ncbi:MAG: S1C family serine protease [Pseudomonadales bacterium]
MRLPSLLLPLLILASSGANAGDLSSVFSKVDKAVVVIATEATQSKISRHGIATATESGLGSGVIISPKGTVLTAAHVVDNADRVKVKLLNGDTYTAKVVSSVLPADVALIQLQAVDKKLPYVDVSDSDRAKVGTEIFIVGAPYGLEHTLTVGYLSGRRLISGEDTLLDVEFLQTDAAVNQGNSGGPMFTAKGELIGIVSHIRSQSGGSEGLGFAASSKMIQRSLLDQPPIWFGMEYIPLRGDLAEAMNIGADEGLLVQRVAKGSLGEAFGLRESYIPATVSGHDVFFGGDIILQLGGQNIYLTHAGRDRIFKYFNGVAAGKPLEMTVLRNGERMTLTAAKP